MAIPIVIRVQSRPSTLVIKGVPVGGTLGGRIQGRIDAGFRGWKGPQKFTAVKEKILAELDPDMRDGAHIENETDEETIQFERTDVVAAEP